MEERKTTILAVAGKGGVGKTSVAATLVRLLCQAHPDKKILAIDADPAVGLSTALGVETGLTVDDIRKAVVRQAQDGSTQAAVELLGEARCRIFDAVTEKPGENYNPLFIYGDSGLGKTHLLYAIANALRKKRPAAKIVYIKGDDFTNELVASIRENRNAEFREKYRQTDILLMDDIQFIAGKIQTQEEFFHTFNTLYESGKQIVLTSDRPPKEITQLEDRLRTRFEWGLMVDVAPPDFETRFAIVQNKAALLGVKLPNEVTDYIAENITSNVRQIEGTLNKILAYRDLLDDQVNEETVSRAIRDMLKKSNDFAPTPKTIISYICSYCGVDEATLRGQSRGREVVAARQIAIYLIRRMSGMSLNDIGKEFGDRDHSTILHSLEKVEKQMRSDPAFAEKVKEITTNINSKK